MNFDVAVMLAVVGVTALLVTFFLVRYRKSNRKAHYDPSWSHSNLLEIFVWGIPLAIVAVLGYYSYRGIFEVNPYDPTVITHPKGHTAEAGFHLLKPPAPQAAAHAIAAGARPLTVDVITTDWQWVFIYPRQHIATVDRLVVPVHTPVRFRLTSATVVNDFFIPELVGEIDVMPGMRTKQEMLADTVGTYGGFSADFSGGGFSWMRFATQVISPAHFKAWVQRQQQAPRSLTYATFDALAKPTINLHETPSYYSHVQPGLFDHVVRQVMRGRVYTTPMAMTEDMHHMTQVRLVK